MPSLAARLMAQATCARCRCVWSVQSRRVLRACVACELQPRQVLLRKGEQRDEVFIVRHGTLCQRKGAAGGAKKDGGGAGRAEGGGGVGGEAGGSAEGGATGATPVSVHSQIASLDSNRVVHSIE